MIVWGSDGRKRKRNLPSFYCYQTSMGVGHSELQTLILFNSFDRGKRHVLGSDTHCGREAGLNSLSLHGKAWEESSPDPLD